MKDRKYNLRPNSKSRLPNSEHKLPVSFWEFLLSDFSAPTSLQEIQIKNVVNFYSTANLTWNWLLAFTCCTQILSPSKNRTIHTNWEMNDEYFQFCNQRSLQHPHNWPSSFLSSLQTVAYLVRAGKMNDSLPFNCFGFWFFFLNLVFSRYTSEQFVI